MSKLGKKLVVLYKDYWKTQSQDILNHEKQVTDSIDMILLSNASFGNSSICGEILTNEVFKLHSRQLFNRKALFEFIKNYLIDNKVSYDSENDIFVYVFDEFAAN